MIDLIKRKKNIISFLELNGSNCNKRPMGHIAHPRKQFKSINTYDYHNIDKEKEKPIIYFIGIKWFFI